MSIFLNLHSQLVSIKEVAKLMRKPPAQVFRLLEAAGIQSQQLENVPGEEPNLFYYFPDVAKFIDLHKKTCVKKKHVSKS
jgi:hypothetical protein